MSSNRHNTNENIYTSLSIFAQQDLQNAKIVEYFAVWKQRKTILAEFVMKIVVGLFLLV